MSREPCYKCKFEAKPIDCEPCEYCSNVYIETGDHPHFKRAKPLTNYDRLHAMGPEELAKLFMGNACPPVDGDCPYLEQEVYRDDRDCGRCWLDWLKQPAEEVETWQS